MVRVKTCIEAMKDSYCRAGAILNIKDPDIKGQEASRSGQTPCREGDSPGKGDSREVKGVPLWLDLTCPIGVSTDAVGAGNPTRPPPRI